MALTRREILASQSLDELVVKLRAEYSNDMASIDFPTVMMQKVAELSGSNEGGSEGGGLAGTSYTYVAADGTPVENGAAFHAAYDALPVDLAVDNPHTIIVAPGKYDLRAHEEFFGYHLYKPNVNVISLTGEPVALFTMLDIEPFGVNEDHRLFVGINTYDFADDSTYDGGFPFNMYGVTSKMTFKNCKFGEASFNGQEGMSGTFLNCVFGAGSILSDIPEEMPEGFFEHVKVRLTNNDAVLGSNQDPIYMKDCTFLEAVGAATVLMSGVIGWHSGSSFRYIVNGTFINIDATAVNGGFANTWAGSVQIANSYFENCRLGNNGGAAAFACMNDFSNGKTLSITGSTFKNCHSQGKGFVFGVGSNNYTNQGVYWNCSVGDSGFSTDPAGYEAAFAGELRNCSAVQSMATGNFYGFAYNCDAFEGFSADFSNQTEMVGVANNCYIYGVGFYNVANTMQQGFVYFCRTLMGGLTLNASPGVIKLSVRNTTEINS